jgi:AAA+ ATPase superfamily predicted ATPase
METPFVFGKIAKAKNFTDRKQETEKLLQNFISSTNTILISPRRWGKTSLVRHASELLKKKNREIKFCFVDLNNVRTEEQFYQYFTTAVLRSTSNRAKELLDNARSFLGRFTPSLTFSPGPASEFRLGMDWKEVTRSPEDVLDLAEKIGAQKKLRIVICVDEFQNIAGFEDHIGFQKKLRAQWQQHQRTSYCIYGSKRHMMMDVFTSPSMPFYKFGDIIFLEKILSDEWVRFIKERFAQTGKTIADNDSRLIADLADCHPYYVQQLAQQAWLRTERICTSEIVLSAFNSLVLQLSMLFQNLTDGLSNTQVNFLKALTNNVERLSSQDTIIEYGLGTSGNVIKIKKKLVSDEIIDIIGNRITFLDPLYKKWLLDYYFLNQNNL